MVLGISNCHNTKVHKLNKNPGTNEGSGSSDELKLELKKLLKRKTVDKSIFGIVEKKLTDNSWPMSEPKGYL